MVTCLPDTPASTDRTASTVAAVGSAPDCERTSRTIEDAASGRRYQGPNEPTGPTVGTVRGPAVGGGALVPTGDDVGAVFAGAVASGGTVAGGSDGGSVAVLVV